MFSKVKEPTMILLITPGLKQRLCELAKGEAWQTLNFPEGDGCLEASIVYQFEKRSRVWCWTQRARTLALQGHLSRSRGCAWIQNGLQRYLPDSRSDL